MQCLAALALVLGSVLVATALTRCRALPDLVPATTTSSMTSAMTTTRCARPALLASLCSAWLRWCR